MAQQFKHLFTPIKIGAPGGRYIMSADAPDDETPLANFLAAREAIHKYGKYPLKF